MKNYPKPLSQLNYGAPGIKTGKPCWPSMGKILVSLKTDFVQMSLGVNLGYGLVRRKEEKEPLTVHSSTGGEGPSPRRSLQSTQNRPYRQNPRTKEWKRGSSFQKGEGKGPRVGFATISRMKCYFYLPGDIIKGKRKKGGRGCWLLVRAQASLDDQGWTHLDLPGQREEFRRRSKKDCPRVVQEHGNNLTNRQVSCGDPQSANGKRNGGENPCRFWEPLSLVPEGTLKLP